MSEHRGTKREESPSIPTGGAADERASGELAEPVAVDTGEWVEQYGDYLFRFAMFRVNRRELAEELVQETFLAAHAARDRFERRSSVKTWLVTILKNKIIDHFRKASREPDESIDDMGVEAVHSSFNRLGIWNAWLGEWESTPERLLEQKGFMERLHKCVNSLPEKFRRVFLLRVVDDVSTEEICKELSISANNLWVILYRARMQLRECLDKNWFSPRGERE